MIANVPARVLELLTVQQVKPARAATPRSDVLHIGSVVALDQLSRVRVIKYTGRVGFGLSDGRKTAAYRLACFYVADVGLAEHLAAHCLGLWNALNAPPLPETVIATILHNAGRYARGKA